MSDSRELAHASQGGAIAHAAPQTESERRFTQTIQMVREAMLNPDVDANKAKVMAELMTSLEDRSMQAEFNRDLNAAILEMPVITKDGVIKIPANRDKGTPERIQGRFARYEDIDRVVKPIAARHNLAYRFEIGTSDKGLVTVRPIISHRNGYTERGEAMSLPIDSSGSKNNTQGVGSSASYGKRYALCAAFNIVTEGVDDDGRGGSTVTLPYEREMAVLDDAEAAAAEGRYQEWYQTQSPKDRGWLVSSGHHQRLGGGKALPGSSAPVERDDPPPQQEQPRQRQQRRDPPPADQGQPAGRDVRTPEGWTAQYEDDCAAAPDLETLARVQTKGKNGLDRLAEAHPALHKRAVDAGTKAFRRLSGDDDSGGDDAPAGGDLFGGEGN